MQKQSKNWPGVQYPLKSSKEMNTQYTFAQLWITIILLVWEEHTTLYKTQ